MTRIAHVTDLHLVEANYLHRSAGERARLQYLNTGRRIDAGSRRAHAIDALRAALVADHVVLTGDLTEDGVLGQFEVLAEVLAAVGADPQRVTLVPGNHDVYAGPDAWGRALAGPLARFAAPSRASEPIDLGEALLLPISTAVPQTCLRSAGALQAADAQRIAEVAEDCKALIVAQHHPPLGLRNPLMNWIDGLCDPRASIALLHAHEHLQVLHGHVHYAASRAVAEDRIDQVHCAAATLESPLHVRFYELIDGRLFPLDRPHAEDSMGSRVPRTACVEVGAVSI